MTKMKKIKYAFCLWLMLIVTIQAGDNSIWIHDGYGAAGTGSNSVGVVLSNQDTVGGFQFNLHYDHTALQFQNASVAPMIDHMDLYVSEPDSGILTVIVVNLGGESIHPMVEEPIIDIEYFVDENSQNEPIPLTLTNVTFSDAQGNTVSGESAGGYFFVDGANSIRVENGSGVSPISLYNDFPVAGVQFEISFDASILVLDQIERTDRVSTMTLLHNESNGVVTVLLYSASQTIILPGAGPILNLHFNNISGGQSSVVIDISNVAISESSGTTADVDYFSGTYFIDPNTITETSILLLDPAAGDIIYTYGMPGEDEDSTTFSWSNSYGNIGSAEVDTSILWMGFVDPYIGLLDYTYWIVDPSNNQNNISFSNNMLIYFMQYYGLMDSMEIIWDVIQFNGGFTYFSQYDGQEQYYGSNGAAMAYYDYLFTNDIDTENIRISDNGPFDNLILNDSIDVNQYHDLYFVLDSSVTNGHIDFWDNNDLQISIGDCYESIGDNWYSYDYADEQIEFYFYSDCEPGTETLYQLRLVPGDGWTNGGYESEVSMFYDLGIDTMIYHQLDIHPLPEQYIGITEAGGIPGDTVSLSVYADLGQSYPMYSFELTVAGLGGGDISAVGVDTAGTVMNADWLWSYYISDSGNVVITAGAGAEPVAAMGSLFNVHFVINGGSSGGFFPVFITDAVFNEDEDMQVYTDPGGVMVLGIGDVSMNGRVGSFDASLVLRHLVGLDTLSADQINIGDVTDDNSLSALDAAIILDYVVGIVDGLPFVPGISSMTAGSFVLPSRSVEPGQSFQVPIEFTDGTNVRSFELEMSYDPQALSVDQIVWDMDVLSGLQVLDNQQDGVVKVSAAGMGSLSSGALTLGYIEFSMDEFFNDYETSVTISRSRANESDVVIDGSVGVYTNSMLVASDWGEGGVPLEFALKQNYPNPFNPSTMIRYQLPEETNVTVAIYDIMGRKVRTLLSSENQLAGYRQVLWNATNDLGQPVSAGMYIYTIQAGTFRMTKKMVLMK